MSCSAGCLANTYHRCVKRVVHSSSAGWCVVDVPGSREDASDSRPSLWELAKVKEGEVAVRGVRGAVFVFDAQLLAGAAVRLVNTIKEMPLEVRKSVCEDGIPWIRCMEAPHLRGVADDVLLERILAMCMAMNFMEIVDSAEDVPMPYVVVDDVGIQRRERLKDIDVRSRAIGYW